MRLVVYVHQNPQKHKFENDFRDRMMQLFGSQEDFIRIHQEIQPLEDFEDED